MTSAPSFAFRRAPSVGVNPGGAGSRPRRRESRVSRQYGTGETPRQPGLKGRQIRPLHFAQIVEIGASAQLATVVGGGVLSNIDHGDGKRLLRASGGQHPHGRVGVHRRQRITVPVGVKGASRSSEKLAERDAHGVHRVPRGERGPYVSGRADPDLQGSPCGCGRARPEASSVSRLTYASIIHRGLYAMQRTMAGCFGDVNPFAGLQRDRRGGEERPCRVIRLDSGGVSDGDEAGGAECWSRGRP